LRSSAPREHAVPPGALDQTLARVNKYLSAYIPLSETMFVSYHSLLWLWPRGLRVCVSRKFPLRPPNLEGLRAATGTGCHLKGLIK